jgi:capsid assembly protein
MTDPVPNPTPAPTPAPSPAPAPAPVSRPEWLPEAHWDTAANSMKPEFGTHYAELATFHKTQTEQQAALAARKPEDIKLEVKLPETVKVPDGMDLKINENDPRVPVLRELALKNNLSQDVINSLVALDAQQQIAAHAAEQTRIAAEDAKLGANAKERKDAVGNWLKGMKDRNEITAEEFEAVRVYAIDAAAVTALEKIIQKATGTVPGHTPGNPQKPADVPMESRWYQQKAS